jgi:very-short-patch-repair endonuclease
VPESVDAWWARRQWSKGAEIPYAIGQYRSDWAQYPVLVRQYHPEFNHGITLTQIPPAADVFLVWQCEVGHIFVATPEEQRGRPGGQRRRSSWCPDCAQQAVPKRVKPEAPTAPPPKRAPKPMGEVRARRASPANQYRVGDPFISPWAPKPASAVEAELRQLLAARFDFDFRYNAVRVSRPFFDHLEVWPDFVIAELGVAIEYDTTGRHGLEHVGRREETDKRKDRLLRVAGWEVIRIRCGKLQPIGPYDLHSGGVNLKLVGTIADRLAEIAGQLMVDAYSK